MRRPLALAAVLLAGCGGSAPPAVAPTIVVAGTMVVSDVLDEDAGACVAKRAFDDIAAGATVTVTDPAGKVVGIGELGPGMGEPDGGGFADCAFAFAVTAPAGLKFYGVEVGRRGVVRYAEPDLSGPVQIRLG